MTVSSFLSPGFPSVGLPDLISGKKTFGGACACRSSTLPTTFALESLVKMGVRLSGASY